VQKAKEKGERLFCVYKCLTKRVCYLQGKNCLTSDLLNQLNNRIN
jgi:hypothetical protein